MRLHWFSPLPPAATEIGHYTTRILPSLTELAEVTLWTDQSEWDISLETRVTVRRYQLECMPWSELNNADACVYHLGNNLSFHGTIWQVSHVHPGIVVLHDLRLQDLFAGLFRDQLQDPSKYVTVMQQQYGEAGRQDAERFLQGICSIDDMAERYPLTELSLENSLGAVVHSEQGFEAVRSRRRWPVMYAPLPHPAAPHLEKNRGRAARVRGVEPPFRLIVFGHIGRNRRVEVLLHALAAFPMRDRFRLDIYGWLLNQEAIRGLIQSLDLGELVSLRGFVPDSELNRALAAAHLALNLRYPTMGEASASQLRIWEHALPSLVTKVGWYASLPEDAVAFVRPEHEMDDIQAHLRAFLADPPRFARMGENARNILEERHAPESYAQAIVDFASYAERFRVREVAYGLAERVGTEIGAWIGPAESDQTFTSAARAIHALASDEPPPRARELA
jgi:glycosyltransferase involved in cell wall biosynthesis